MLPTVDEKNLDRVRTVLIIEDDELVAGIYKRKFESAGFKVHVEMDGSEGYYRISEMRPDAVLLDLLLPGMDGPVIIGKFRAQPKFRDLPIIVYTNAYLSEAGRDAIKAGATKVFNKATISPGEIVAAVEEVLNRQLPPVPASPQAASPAAREGVDSLSLLAESSFAHPPKPENATPFSAGVAPEERVPRPEAAQPVPAVNPAPAAPGVDEAALEKVRRDQAFLMTAEKSFLEKSESRLGGMRQIVRSLSAEASESAKTQAFLNLSRIAHVMGSNAAVIGMNYLAHLATAFEALAWELFEKPSQFRLPTQKTLAKAIDTMARLIACGSSFQLKEFRRFNVLVVDDHRIARTMINRALDRANLSHVSIGQPEIALELLKENEFELVILDVKMDGISGVDLCTALRKIPHQKQSRVLFVSAMKDIQTRVASIQAGGNDYIVKPFVPMELAVSVLLHMIDLQLSQPLPEQTERSDVKAN